MKTAAGTAVSTDDFIVPPSPFVVSDVASASRFPFATATTVTVSTANKIALRLFDLTAGQRVSLMGTNARVGSSVRLRSLSRSPKPFGQLLGHRRAWKGTAASWT